MKTRSHLIALGLWLAAIAHTAAQPTITLQPKNQTASLFATATFRVGAMGTNPFSYQWQFNGVPIPDAVSNSLAIPSVQRTNAGSYRVVITDASGSVTSSVATLIIVPFNALYCFGYSWTDTQGLFPDGSHDFTYNNPAYWQNRTANGPMWPEFLSTNLGLTYVSANNYARGNAGSADVLNLVGSSAIGPLAALNLYFLWAGDSDFLWAADANYSGAVSYVPWSNSTGWNTVIRNALNNNSNAVERLYAKGARTIVVQTLDDFSRHPALVRDFGTDTNRVLAFRTRVQTFNSELESALAQISQRKPDLRLVVADLYSDLNVVQDHYSDYGFTKVFPNALDDTNLVDKTFNGPGKDYAYWDGLHATSKLNELIAGWGLDALTNAVLETIELKVVQGAPTLQMNHLQIGRDYTLQSSPDLMQWEELATFTSSAGTNQWSEASPGQTATFYRLTWLQSR